MIRSDPFLPVETFYREHVVSAFMAHHPAAQLVEEIGYHKYQSFDDRTLVCVYQDVPVA